MHAKESVQYLKVSSIRKSIPICPAYNSCKVLWPVFKDTLDHSNNFFRYARITSQDIKINNKN